MRRLAPIGLLLAAASLPVALLARRPTPADREGPRLVLFLVIDQARADYLTRYRPALTGGLGRLLDEGAWFTEAYHEHAVPTTAPGHASLISGRHPARHGIVGNEWIEREGGEQVGAVEDAADEVSPRRLRVSSLGDWLKGVDARSLVFAASAKDRAAVLLAGRRADGAFWFDEELGRWTTSAYYPSPARRFLAAEPERWSADRYFGRVWEPLGGSPPTDLSGVESLDLGVLTEGFPHAVGDPTPAPEEEFYEDFYDSPFTDEVVEEMGEALVRRFRLGGDDAVDLLALSFSAVDQVGHRYGPDSPELVDALRRVDRLIGRLLGFLEGRIGLDRVLVSLSADHGVLRVPEVAVSRGEPGGRLAGERLACPQRLEDRLCELYGEDDWLRSGPFLNEEALTRHGLSRAEVEAQSRRLLEECPEVARVWTRSELLAPAASEGSPTTRLFVHAFDPERSPDLLIQLDPGWVAWTDDATTHLSVDEADRHVPWILRVPGGEPCRIDEAVATVDVAPTLADLLGIPVPSDVDGVSRRRLLQWSDRARASGPTGARPTGACRPGRRRGGA